MRQAMLSLYKCPFLQKQGQIPQTVFKAKQIDCRKQEKTFVKAHKPIEEKGRIDEIRC